MIRWASRRPEQAGRLCHPGNMEYPSRPGGKRKGRNPLDSALAIQRMVIRQKLDRERLTRILTSASAAAAAAAITATGTAATAAAAGTLFTGTGFVDREITALDVLAVDLGDGRLGAFRCGHRHEGEAAGPVGGTIHHEVDFRDGAAGGEKVLEVVFGGIKGKVPDI